VYLLQDKINTKKLKPGLVASYDIHPGNGEGLFLQLRIHTGHQLVGWTVYNTTALGIALA